MLGNEPRALYIVGQMFFHLPTTLAKNLFILIEEAITERVEPQKS